MSQRETPPVGPVGFALAFTTGVRCEACRKKISNQAIVCPHCRVQRGDGACLSRKCPECAETVKWDARKCRYCGAALPEPELPNKAPEVVSAEEPKPVSSARWIPALFMGAVGIIIAGTLIQSLVHKARTEDNPRAPIWREASRVAAEQVTDGSLLEYPEITVAEFEPVPGGYRVSAQVKLRNRRGAVREARTSCIIRKVGMSWSAEDPRPAVRSKPSPEKPAVLTVLFRLQSRECRVKIATSDPERRRLPAPKLVTVIGAFRITLYDCREGSEFNDRPVLKACRRAGSWRTRGRGARSGAPCAGSCGRSAA